MTADISSFTMPCGASQTCRHPICEHCGTPMRSGGELIYGHPGTKQHKRGGVCGTCNTNNFKLIPADLQDQSHVLMSDKALQHLEQNHPDMFAWHMKRRQRINRNRRAIS